MFSELKSIQSIFSSCQSCVAEKKGRQSSEKCGHSYFFATFQDIVSSRDEERENLRRELQKARDQLAELLVLQATAPASTSSRPASHVSLSDCDTSTVAEPTEESPIEASNNLTLDSKHLTDDEICGFDAHVWMHPQVNWR